MEVGGGKDKGKGQFHRQSINWTEEECDALARAVKKHGTGGGWDPIVNELNGSRNEEALSRKWRKIKDSYIDDEGEIRVPDDEGDDEGEIQVPLFVSDFPKKKRTLEKPKVPTATTSTSTTKKEALINSVLAVADCLETSLSLKMEDVVTRVCDEKLHLQWPRE